MFCCAVLCALSSFAIILKGKRELDALLFFLSSWWLATVIVLWLWQCAMGWSVHILLERKFVIVVTRLEYSDVTCHVVLLYSVNWTKIGISFIFPTVNLFRY